MDSVRKSEFIAAIFYFRYCNSIDIAAAGPILKDRLPCRLEDAEKSGATQDADPELRHDARVREYRFDDAADDDEAVEAVEQRHEVPLQADAVHLHQHLDGE